MDLRNRFFEFEDLHWFPDTLRQAMTDYLRCLFCVLHIYTPAIPVIIDALKRANTDTILDLCSGGGGAMEEIEKNISIQSGKPIKIILTDSINHYFQYRDEFLILLNLVFQLS